MAFLRRFFLECSFKRKIIYSLIITFTATILVFSVFYYFLPDTKQDNFKKTYQYPRSVIYETIRNFVFVPKNIPEINMVIDSVSSYTYVNTPEKQKAMYYRMFVHGEKPKDVFVTALKQGNTISRMMEGQKFSIQGTIHLKSLSDTVTEMQLNVKSHSDFLHKLQLKQIENITKKHLVPEFYKGIDAILSKKRKQFSIQPLGFIPTDSVIYRYIQSEADITYFDDIWAPVFTSILIKLYSEGAVDPHKKSFLLIYNYGNKPFVFRAGVPVKRETLKSPSDFTADTLVMQHYYAFEYTGDYWLFPYAFVEAKKFLKSREMVYDTSKPVMERFVVGHSTEDDPANFKTQLLFPIKNNPAE